MTVIKLDAATFAKVKSGDAPVFITDETGIPQLQIALSTILPAVCEREPTADELDDAEKDPVDFPLDEAWEKIRAGEKL